MPDLYLHVSILPPCLLEI